MLYKSLLPLLFLLGKVSAVPWSHHPGHKALCQRHPGHPDCGHCGDGVLDPEEECDDGTLNGTPQSNCLVDCTCAKCGDGIVSLDEECDLGPLNGAPDSPCSADCKNVTHVCGDGVLGPEEECDDGPLNGTPQSNCLANCTCAKCGDGILSLGEECDLGPLNGAPNSGCSVDCKDVTHYCGDGVVDPDLGEECDDGPLNGTPGSNCTSKCQNRCIDSCEPHCGDGIVQPELGEECDDGPLNGNPGSNCTSTCQNRCIDACETRCGDGIVQEPEECDLGPLNGAPDSGCSADCKIVSVTEKCKQCNPVSGLNMCDTTTSCTVTNEDGRAYCACRAGYRAEGLAADDPKQFRLAFPGQEYRVFVAPGVVCSALCDEWYLGPAGCTEVPVRDC